MELDRGWRGLCTRDLPGGRSCPALALPPSCLQGRRVRTPGLEGACLSFASQRFLPVLRVSLWCRFKMPCGLQLRVFLTETYSRHVNTGGQASMPVKLKS